MFFLDLEGATGDRAVADAVEGLRAHADVVRVLGLVSGAPDAARPYGYTPRQR